MAVQPLSIGSASGDVSLSTTVQVFSVPAGARNLRIHLTGACYYLPDALSTDDGDSIATVQGTGRDFGRMGSGDFSLRVPGSGAGDGVGKGTFIGLAAQTGSVTCTVEAYSDG